MTDYIELCIFVTVHRQELKIARSIACIGIIELIDIESTVYGVYSAYRCSVTSRLAFIIILLFRRYIGICTGVSASAGCNVKSAAIKIHLCIIGYSRTAVTAVAANTIDTGGSIKAASTAIAAVATDYCYCTARNGKRSDIYCNKSVFAGFSRCGTFKTFCLTIFAIIAVRSDKANNTACVFTLTIKGYCCICAGNAVHYTYLCIVLEYDIYISFNFYRIIYIFIVVIIIGCCDDINDTVSHIPRFFTGNAPCGIS